LQERYWWQKKLKTN